ncbi:MAG: lysylphosphatidylglycerol synthase transmembrane domain-containing protein [Bacillota bacterium]|nr:lysylphosphatidylglycerol synthase transmembrane domain-containing protein [Bacillota bacterium]
MSKIDPDLNKLKEEVNGKSILSTKMISYSILTVVFVATSFLSLLFVYHVFADNTSFINMKMFSYKAMIQIAILLLLYFSFNVLRLFYILKTLGIFIDIKYIFKLVFINIFISNITPSAGGGGFAQIYFLNKRGVSVVNAIASTTIRTILSMMFFLVSTPIVIIFNRNLLNLFTSNGSLLLALILIFFYAAIVYFVYKAAYNPKIIKRIVYIILKLLVMKNILSSNNSKKIRKKTFKEINNFSKSFITYLNGNRKYIFLSIIFTILFLLSLFSFVIIFLKELGYDISPLTTIALQIMISFITYFAPTPGATGIAEGGFTLVFSNFVNKSDIVSLTFAWRFFTIYVGMLLGMVFFYLELIKKPSIKK